MGHPADESRPVGAAEAYRLLFERVDNMVCTLDLEGRFTSINRAGEALTGYTADELVGRLAIEVIAPEHREDAMRQYARRVLGEAGESVEESMLLSRDGTRVPIQIASTRFAHEGAPAGVLAVVHDLTDRLRAAENESRFRGSFEAAASGMALVAPDGSFLEVNASLCEMVGYAADELVERTFQDITHPDDLEADLDNVHRMLRGEITSYQMTKRYFNRSGDIVWVLLSVSLVRAADGAPRYFVSQIQDISEQKRTAERLTELTLRDPLTGLANRVLFADRLSHAVERSRQTRERIAVLFIDLDRFKSVNDNFGHAAGDELLRQAAERMRGAVRPADTVARLGGDEFTVLCEDLNAVNEASWVADRVSAALERPFDLFGSRTTIGVSIGVAVADADDTAEALLDKADAAMYRAKNERRSWKGAA